MIPDGHEEDVLCPCHSQSSTQITASDEDRDRAIIRGGPITEHHFMSFVIFQSCQNVLEPLEDMSNQVKTFQLSSIPGVYLRANKKGTLVTSQ